MKYPAKFIMLNIFMLMVPFILIAANGEKSMLKVYPIGSVPAQSNIEITLASPDFSNLKAGKTVFDFKIRKTEPADPVTINCNSYGLSGEEYSNEFYLNLKEGTYVLLAIVAGRSHSGIKNQKMFLLSQFAVKGPENDSAGMQNNTAFSEAEREKPFTDIYVIGINFPGYENADKIFYAIIKCDPVYTEELINNKNNIQTDLYAPNWNPAENLYNISKSVSAFNYLKS